MLAPMNSSNLYRRLSFDFKFCRLDLFDCDLQLPAGLVPSQTKFEALLIDCFVEIQAAIELNRNSIYFCGTVRVATFFLQNLWTTLSTVDVGKLMKMFPPIRT